MNRVHSSPAIRVDLPPAEAGTHRPVPLRLVTLLTLLFAIGVALGSSGRVDFIGQVAGNFFNAYVQAQYLMLQAQGNVNTAGNAEYAVRVDDQAQLAQFVSGLEGWSLRAASLPGWQVVSAPADQRDGLMLLKRQPFVTLALKNRGLWICH